MLEFEVIQELELNGEILEIIKDYEYAVKNGRIKHLKVTNLQFIEPNEYAITKPVILTIYEYKVNEIASKNFYIKEYNIEITNIKFTEQFISKSSKDYIEYLYEVLQNNNIGFIYKEAISKEELEKLQEDYFIFTNTKIANNEYDNATLTIYKELLKQNFYTDGIINCPYIENENIVDYLTLIPKISSEVL